jgi:BirA family biotin operon repressor/biotin-[acetyl-CoA-carboxylase] ligase
VHRFASIDSTNTWLLGQARAGAAAGLVAVADHQTAGRGRLGRTWESPGPEAASGASGPNLLCSVLLRPPLLVPGGAPFLAVARVSLAARAAASAVSGGRVAAGLKWPNDLVVDGAKLAGVLAEAERDVIVAGCGMNVTWAPPGAARLRDAAPSVHRDAVLDALLRSLDDWLVADDRMVLRAYREACVTLGRPVRVDVADDDAVSGTAADVTDTGALLVDTGACLREVTVGDVVHLR